MAKRVQHTFTARKPRKHGRVAKSKTTFNKGGDNYTKRYRGQGR
jgi:hypothetical protein